MSTTQKLVHEDRTAPDSRRRVSPRVVLAVAFATLIVAIVATVVIVRSAGETRPHSTSEGIVPSRNDDVRALVARGLVPAATLDDGTHITSGRLQRASRSRDDDVRALVARGLVPAATLDDGTRIVG